MQSAKKQDFHTPNVVKGKQSAGFPPFFRGLDGQDFHNGRFFLHPFSFRFELLESRSS